MKDTFQILLTFDNAVERSDDALETFVALELSELEEAIKDFNEVPQYEKLVISAHGNEDLLGTQGNDFEIDPKDLANYLSEISKDYTLVLDACGENNFSYGRKLAEKLKDTDCISIWAATESYSGNFSDNIDNGTISNIYKKK